MLTKFKGDKISIMMSSINCLDPSFRRTCNLTFGFLKYEFSNKLLGGVTFFRVTLSLTRTQPYIS